MESAFLQGDHVLTFNWKKPQIGDVIVFEFGKIYKIKRAVKTSADLIFVAGDNRRVSSRVGPIEVSKIIGKVILKY